MHPSNLNTFAVPSAMVYAFVGISKAYCYTIERTSIWLQSPGMKGYIEPCWPSGSLTLCLMPQPSSGRCCQAPRSLKISCTKLEPPQRYQTATKCGSPDMCATWAVRIYLIPFNCLNYHFRLSLLFRITATWVLFLSLPTFLYLANQWASHIMDDAMLNYTCLSTFVHTNSFFMLLFLLFLHSLPGNAMNDDSLCF